MKKIYRWYLKHRLKSLYIKIETFDEYDCGHKLKLTLSSYYYNLCSSFNKVAEKLSKIDENCPSFRYDLNP